jgi:hypothetical protein
MQPTELSALIHNPMLIYSFLALYGVLTVVLFTYVRSKFRLATKTLKALETEWQSATSRHAGFVGAAQEKLSKLSVPPPVATSLSVRNKVVNFDVRNQVVAMAKRGVAPQEIARTCGLNEGEIEVVLGLVRLAR